ncbi:MAG: hypothetical protein CME71_13005 [Halobacteriovorax sp.]|nr:hypothetical protein [Halobacteriovorax sp.]
MFSSTSSSITPFNGEANQRILAPASYVRVKHFPLLLVGLFFLSGCTSYINLIDDAPEALPLKQSLVQKLSCDKMPIVASQSSEDNKTLDDVFNSLNLTIEEELILAILQQMAVRPATTSPWARLQVSILKNNKWTSFDYYKAAPAKPLWQGLQDLTVRLKLKPLNHYLRLAEKIFPSSMEIGSPFAQYLEKYKSPLSEDIAMGQFFKAGQILKSGESIPSLKWTRLPKLLKDNEPLSPLRSPVFNSTSFESTKVQCNFDIDLYSKSVYLVRPDPGVNYNILARLKKNTGFVFISSVELQDPKPIQAGVTILRQLPALRPAPICLVEREKDHQLLMSSLKGRDPGQHLYNLLQYSIDRATKIEEVGTYLSFPRHQFLYGPARMLYESSRGSATNLESFLKMDFPIYHSPALGEVWVWGKFQDGSSGLSVDERTQASLRCPK